MKIYVHIPFCEKKCDYCAFFSVAGASDEIKEQYTAALIRQISAFSQCNAETVYIGGGTPPVLGRKNLTAVLDCIYRHFSLCDDAEITVEVNPKTVDKEYLMSLRQTGVNRLSVGVQSLNDDELRRIGRIHTASDAINTIRQAHEAGFENISADMIFALPFQTVSDTSRTLCGLLDCGITHLSAYSLQPEENTPLWHSRDMLSFPTEEEEESIYNLICQKMKNAGFRHYEVSSFAKPGYYSRHNSAYWTGEEYMGFGAAAHSLIGKKRFKAVSDIRKYIALALSEDPFSPTDFASAAETSAAEAREEEIMLSLRTSRGVDIKMIDAAKAERFATYGLGEITDGRFVLNDKGYRVSNYIISELI